MSFATNKILLLFFCALFISSNAQNEFKTFTKSDGLTSSNISFTHLDSKGIIWAATNSGINAFTGKKWISIKSISDDNGRDKTLGRVLKISETSKGELWIATEKGLFNYNRQYWTYFSDQDNKEFYVKDIFEDKKGNIWVMLEKKMETKDIGDIGFSIVEGLVQMYNGSQWFDFPGLIGGSAAVVIGEPKEYFTSIIQDEKGNIWVTSLDGLYIYNGRTWIEYNDEDLPSDKCYKVIETSDNIIWVATSNGIAKQKDNEWIKYEKSKGIKNNLTYNLYEDSQSRLWAFTRKDHKFKALCFYENDKWQSCFSSDIQLKGEITQLIEFNNKILAFSTKGISLFYNDKWHNLEDIYKFDDDKYSAIKKVNDNSIWFTTENGLYHLNNDLEKVFSAESKWKVTSVYESSNAEIWVGTEKNGLYMINNLGNSHYTTDNGLKDNRINEIFEDKNKNIWVVTRNGISQLK